MKFLVIAFFLTLAFKAAGDEEEAPLSIGPGKAVLEVQPESKRFKLSETAIKKLGIEFQNVTGMSVPSAALVEHQQHAGIFRKTSDGFFELVKVTVSNRLTEKSAVKSEELKNGDSIAVKGVSLLRATQLDLFEESASHED